MSSMSSGFVLDLRAERGSEAFKSSSRPMLRRLSGFFPRGADGCLLLLLDAGTGTDRLAAVLGRDTSSATIKERSGVVVEFIGRLNVS